MQERQVLRRERLLFLGVTPRRGAEFYNLSLEMGNCRGQVICRRRALGRNLDLSEQLTVRRVKRIAAPPRLARHRGWRDPDRPLPAYLGWVALPAVSRSSAAR